MKSLLSHFAPNRSTVTPFASKKVGDVLVATDDVFSGHNDGADISGKEADDTSDNLPLLKQSLSGDITVLASDEKAVDGAKTSFWKSSHVQGLGFIVFSSLNFSIASACIKYDSRYISSHESMFWRISINLIINYVSSPSVASLSVRFVLVCNALTSALWQIWLRRDHVDLAIRAKERGILLFRCFIGALGTSLSFYAMANMVLTDATVIIFTSPIATFLFVGEHAQWWFAVETHSFCRVDCGDSGCCILERADRTHRFRLRSGLLCRSHFRGASSLSVLDG